MARVFQVRGPSTQRGRGSALTLLIVMLVAVVLGAVVIRQMLAPVGGAKSTGSGPGLPDTATQSGLAPGNAAPGTALDRARALEGDLKRQSEDLDKRIDKVQESN